MEHNAEREATECDAHRQFAPPGIDVGVALRCKRVGPCPAYLPRVGLWLDYLDVLREMIAQGGLLVSDTAGMHTAEEVETPVAQDTYDVLDMITGSWVSQITGAIAVLHIPDHLAEGVRTADEIARLEGSEPPATFRLMRAASSVGLLKYLGQNRFGLSGAGSAVALGRSRFVARDGDDTNGPRPMAVLGAPA